MALNKKAIIKERRKVSGTSRYLTCDLVVTDDHVRLTFKRNRSSLDVLTKYKTGQIPHARTSRPDLMAYSAYGNSALFWVLYYFNRAVCQGPFRFHQGDVISLPHPSDITKWITRKTV